MSMEVIAIFRSSRGLDAQKLLLFWWGVMNVLLFHFAAAEKIIKDRIWQPRQQTFVPELLERRKRQVEENLTCHIRDCI